mmetsp:Transcript_24693/g.63731  ORF Transcript_24693/g.63731 Transcript_24693/m.63731 type:complete len:216 (+) Transcript_24693:564-1211(+)
MSVTRASAPLASRKHSANELPLVAARCAAVFPCMSRAFTSTPSSCNSARVRTVRSPAPAVLAARASLCSPLSPRASVACTFAPSAIARRTSSWRIAAQAAKKAASGPSSVAGASLTVGSAPCRAWEPIPSAAGLERRRTSSMVGGRLRPPTAKRLARALARARSRSRFSLIALSCRWPAQCSRSTCCSGRMPCKVRSSPDGGDGAQRPKYAATVS